jgi:hypothetical protein
MDFVIEPVHTTGTAGQFDIADHDLTPPQAGHTLSG